MITLFSGIPGSGKTYKMVAELSRQKEKYYVVHNIDGLQEGYLGDYGINFLNYCEDQKIDIVEFFSKEYQNCVFRFYPVQSRNHQIPGTASVERTGFCFGLFY